MRGLILALTLSLLITAPAGAQSLTLDHQEARVTRTTVTADGVRWQLEIRDICLGSVRRYEMELPCSDWRPLTAKGPDRQPSFKGEVELPDGKIVKYSKKADGAGGEHYTVKGLLLTDEAVESAGEWYGEHQEATPGIWLVDADDLGDAYISRANLEHPVEAWLMELRASARDTRIVWNGDKRYADVTLEKGTTDLHGPGWHCAALKKLEAKGGPETDKETFEVWFANVAIADPVCPTTANWLRVAVCGQAGTFAKGMGAATSLEEMLPLAPDGVALVSSCPDTYTAQITDAVRGAYAKELQKKDLERLVAFIDGFEPVMGSAWRVEAGSGLMNLLDVEVERLIQSGQLMGAFQCIDSRADLAGDEWASQSRLYLEATVNRQLDAMLGPGAETAVEQFITAYAPLLGVEWRARVMARHRWLSRMNGVRIVPIEPGTPVPMDIHTTGGVETIEHNVGADGTGQLVIRSAAGKALITSDTVSARYHLIDLGGEAWLFRAAAVGGSATSMQFTLEGVSRSSLKILWRGSYHGEELELPNIGMFVPVGEDGLGLVMAREQAGQGTRTEFFLLDDAKGTFAEAPAPEEAGTLRYADGHLRCDGKLVDGLRQGVWNQWYSSGIKALEGEYVDGRRQGEWIAWYPSGRRKAEASFVGDNAVSTPTFYNEQGRVITPAEFLAVYGDGDVFRIPTVAVAPSSP